MPEVTIKLDSADREGTIASFTEVLQTVYGLPPEKTRRGIELAFDAHNKVLDLLMEHTNPEDVGLPSSVAAMFVFQQMEVSHAKASAESVQECLAAAALHHKLGVFIGED